MHSPKPDSDPHSIRFELRPWKCPICIQSDEKFVGYRGGTYHRHGLGEVSSIVRCCRCTLLYPNPFPIPLESSNLYGDPKSYFLGHIATTKIRGNEEILKKLKNKLKAPLKVLDVGSGCGELLVAAKNLGIDATGIEFSEGMIRYAQENHGVKIEKKTIEMAADIWPKTYNAVILNAVLEHVHDPNAMILSASLLLLPQGVLYIDVPNEPNLLTRVGQLFNRLRRNEGVYNLSPTWPPFHVYGFNSKSITVLLEKHGFQIEEIDIFADPRIPSRSHWKDRLKAFLACQINRMANWTGTAGNMTVWARKI